MFSDARGWMGLPGERKLRRASLCYSGIALIYYASTALSTRPDTTMEEHVMADSVNRSRASCADGLLPLCEKPVSSGSLAHCPVDHLCGACQHVGEPYADQLIRKDAQVAKLFRDLAGCDAIRSITGMDDPFHYRNKVVSPYAPGRKLPHSEDSAKRVAGKRTRAHGRGRAGARAPRPRHEILCGMYAAHSHRIVPTDGCLIENDRARAIISAIRDLMPRFGIEPYREDAGSGFLRHVIVRVGHTSGEILVTLVTNGDTFPASRSFCRELIRRHPGVTTIVQNVNERQTNVILGEREQRLYGPGFILDRLSGLSFRISSRSFYQVNAIQTEVLYQQAVELAALSGSETVIDAYCGTGTIGLVAAKHGAARVIGVDSVPSAIRDARENARHNGVGNAQFVVGDAGEFMRACAGAGDMADVLFMDPPRAGASAAFLEALVALAPRRIVYISCNPETQVRDLAYLCRHGYAVRVVQPVDMFPHTDHIEVCCLLSKSA